MLEKLLVQFDTEEAANRLVFNIDDGSQTRIFFFRSDDILLTPRADALAASALIPAMRSGSSLCISGTLSGQLRKNLSAIQNLYSSWHPELINVPIESGGHTNVSERRGSRVGLFFSGGVDSFYTLLKHRDEITDLIFVHGFDISADQSELGENVAGHLRAAATRFGKQLVVIQTDVRRMLSGFGEWGNVTHGAALAASAHLLPDEFRKVYISASYYHEYLKPWGSHPELDPLWSSDGLEIEHDGCEARRFDKIRKISGDPVAMQFLRVCWKNKDGAYNCCRCEKCLRTMLDLQAAGVLSQCTAFDLPLVPRRIRWMKERYPGLIQRQLEQLPDIPENRYFRLALLFAERRNKIRCRIKRFFNQ